MSTMPSQIASLAIVYSTVCSGADERKHQSSVSLAFMRGIHRWPVNSPHKGPVTRKMFPFDDVIMKCFEMFKPVVAKRFSYTHSEVRRCGFVRILSCSWQVVEPRAASLLQSSISLCDSTFNSMARKTDLVKKNTSKYLLNFLIAQLIIRCPVVLCYCSYKCRL